MSEYISLEAAIIGLAVSSLTPNQIDDAAEALNLVPTADVVEVVHGEWIKAVDNETPMLVCSACGSGAFEKEYRFALGSAGLTYCPYCGAKMDGGADNGES